MINWIPLEELLLHPIRNGLTKPKSVRGKGVKMIAMGEIFSHARINDIEMDRVPVTDKEMNNCFICEGDLLFARQSLVFEGAGKCSIVTVVKEPTVFESHLIRARIDTQKANPYYVFYYFNSPHGRENIGTIVEQVAAAGVRGSDLIKLKVPCPDVKTQNKIAEFLKRIDEKIELNVEINNNLFEQAVAVFDSMFSNTALGNCRIGDYITPKRGKTLLSKDAIEGAVPVVAGGLEPSTYHNTSNTVAPVLAISASGANAGYVSLWNIPIWSSDSSFIDSSMTDTVYFWYVLLKKRQKEIFDAQTGSAQPHIYPQHIAAMPIIDLDMDKARVFNSVVTPFFETIGANLSQNNELNCIRDAILPQLMSGKLDISQIEA